MSSWSSKMLHVCEIPGRARTASPVTAAWVVMMLLWCCLLPGCMGDARAAFLMAAASPHHIQSVMKLRVRVHGSVAKGLQNFAVQTSPGGRAACSCNRLNKREAPDSSFLAALSQKWFQLLRNPGCVLSCSLYLCSLCSETLCHSTNWIIVVL